MPSEIKIKKVGIIKNEKITSKYQLQTKHLIVSQNMKCFLVPSYEGNILISADLQTHMIQVL